MDTHKKTKEQGFTLIELLVSIGIFFIITALVFVNQQRFGGTILLTNLAYDVALTIRQAQVYGISTKVSAGNSFSHGYGIHFAGNDSFILFVDLDNSDSYITPSGPPSDDGTKCFAGTECLNFYKVSKGNTISRFCGRNDCSGAGVSDLASLDIIFYRPFPEPNPIRGFKQNGASQDYNDASIILTSPQGLTKTVTVLKSGQISIR